MLIVHHNDLDGRCAAAVVRKAMQQKNGLEIIRYVEMDYDKSFDLESVPAGGTVVVVDFSLPDNVMRTLLTEKMADVVWIDHHNSAKKLAYQNLRGIRDFSEPGLCGAELAWKFFMGNAEMPMVLKLVGSYDTWRHDEPSDFAFKEGMVVEDTRPERAVWAELLAEKSKKVEQVVETGQMMMRYRDNYCARMVSSYGYETTFEGLSCYALNVYGFGSLAFGDRVQMYDAVIAYVHNGHQYVVSMYTEKDGVDVSKVCCAYGGGGHTKAAGFVTDELPFVRTTVEAAMGQGCSGCGVKG